MNKEHLKYHRHLGQIADADLNYIKRKDVQYDASWKKRGGVGAWFTIARPMDRLVNFLESVQPAWSQYDLFGAIAVEGMRGEDGTVLACVRDLRRYLLLVEAHMTEELESPSDGAIYAAASARASGVEVGRVEVPCLAELVDLDLADVEQRITSWVTNVTEDDSMEDMYGKLAAEAGLTRQEAKRRIITTLYGGEWPKGYEGGEAKLEPVVTNTPRPGESEEQTLSRSVEGRSELARRGAEAKGPISWGDQSQRRVPRREEPELEPPHEEQSMLGMENTEPDAKWPWISSWGRVSALGPECWDAWHRSGADVVSLEPRLAPLLWAKLPPRVRQCYSPIIPGDKTEPVAFWLRVWEAPADERDRWRTLASELNFKEWSDAMEYSELYKWHEGPGKYIIRADWQGWIAQ